ncbi:hypothetical protein M406DRAFT_265221 [Cryphonectria parasitica EP155]|uniref:F-box domain-containing protein n=1 Tax=Cryphonectria parasitica (strain ATCC 38755 / EP155) TaxID=660469 RepID=A0A9P4XV69_CRYP1|nr:uncharacterized protein M406DRAFT_265221 [Cryphonectria parasitica EP155]KAF3761593.1 hypothetical protein M406DRAFT_265221 [Cryphonectria parasitica EP155]
MILSLEQHGGDGHVLPGEVRIETAAVLSILSNALVLSHVVDYLPIADTLNLAATSKTLQGLVCQTPHVVRRLDLGPIKSLHVESQERQHVDVREISERNVDLQVYEAVPKPEYVMRRNSPCAPLRDAFNALRGRDLLRHVSTLVLDGLPVTVGLVHDIVFNSSIPMRILSLRRVKNLDEKKLCTMLRALISSSRPANTLQLQGLYILGGKKTKLLPIDDTHAWYAREGVTTLSRPIEGEWASTMLACAGVISFDAVLCRGPAHPNSPAYGTINMAANPTVAVHSMSGCANCGSAPEGWTVWGDFAGAGADDETCRFPLLAPLPVHSSSIRAAKCPDGAQTASSQEGFGGDTQPKRFIARCARCAQNRCCQTCGRWWCENLFLSQVHLNRDCWECGIQCHSCIRARERTCAVCNLGYCGLHIAGDVQGRCDCKWSDALRPHPVR